MQLLTVADHKGQGDLSYIAHRFVKPSTPQVVSHIELEPTYKILLVEDNPI